MKPRFPIFIVVMLLVFPILAHAQFDVEITVIIGVEPRIRAEFNETVVLRNATIFKLSSLTPPLVTDTISTEKEPPEAAVTTYLLTPERALTNGNYLIQLVAADFVGNELTFVKPFAINFPETDIRVIAPPLGVTNTTPFNLTIQTIRENIPRPTDCKFASFDPRENFNAFGLQPFDVPPLGTMSAVHTITDFSTKAGLVPNVQGPGFFVICIDDLGRANQKRIYSMIDTIPPVIESVSFDPPRIIEYPLGGGPFATETSVRASEPVICKYAVNQSRPFGEMVRFDSYDDQRFEAFTATNTQTVELPDGDKVTYTIFFQCRDRAGQLTPEFTKEIQVDLSASIGISILSPPQYSTGQTLNLTLTTAKTSACDMVTQDGATEQITTEANPAKFHTTNLGTFDDGTYTLQITCRSGQAGIFQEQTVSHQFTVDTSPPSPPTINGSTVSCAANPLTFTPSIVFTAIDAQSGIKEYRYSVVQLGINQTGSTISKITPPGTANASNATVTYTLSVVAINNAGLVGTPTTTSISVNPLHPLCLEKNPPTVTIREEKKPGEVKINLTCVDESGCDNSTFLYGFADNATCTPFSNYVATFPIFRTQTVCYSVKDMVGNNASGSKRIEVSVANTCTNTVKDGDETDVDCGGSCGSTCLDTKVCRADRDCKNLFCSNGKCATPTCTDNFLNDKETDVDCGGPNCAEKCADNKKCAQNTDCQSNFCNPDLKLCAIPTCMDNFVGGNETDIDCGGNCQQCEENQKCKVDSDCTTNKCEFGYCKLEVAPTTAAPTIVEKTFLQKLGSFMLSWGLIILGVLCIAGGSGYLYYKKTLPAPVRAAPTPGKPAPPRPLTREELAHKRAEEERRKRLEETIKQRVEREEQEKKEKRTRLFEAFGAPKPGAPPERVPERIPLPEAKKEGVKEEWVTLETLKARGLPKAKEKGAPKAEEAFEKLGKIAEKEKTEEDIFAKLPAKEGAEKPEEDIFAKLPSKEEGAIDHEILRRISEAEEKKEAETALRKAKRAAKKRR
ncbi:cell envelope integrity protein TolA [Candidatus Woesearchaeota archaeon]|nr:cell envelope integrity protein TolA [Candidatus Woesearchaeota archaeon]